MVELARQNADADAAAPPGAEPGGPRAAAGPVERLGVHHEDRHDGRVRRERTRVHVLNFNHLYEQLNKNDIDESWLAEIERRHNLFPDLDYRVYA